MQGIRRPHPEGAARCGRRVGEGAAVKGRIVGPGFKGRLALSASALVAALTLMAALSATASALPNNAIDGVDGALQARAQQQSRTLADHLKFPLTHLHLQVGWARSGKDVPNGLTGTNESLNGDIDHNGPVCQIAINKDFFDGIHSRYEQDEVLLHEVFHCYEYDITPNSHSDHEWVMEGLARWADLTIFPRTGFGLALKALTQYYGSPQKSLFARSYDAVGFWAHLQDTTGKLWERIPAIVRGDVGGDDARAVENALAPGHETEVLQSWGSSAFDLPSGPSPSWRMSSPLDGRHFPSPHSPVDVDTSSTFTLAPWSTTQLSIGPGPSGPLIEIHLDQAVHARFGVDEDYLDTDITSRIFCTAANTSECRCPAGDTGSVPPTTPLPHEPDLGAAADGTGGSLVITYLTPADSGYCEPEKPKTGSLPGPISCKGLLPGYDYTIEGEFRMVLGEYESDPVPTESTVDGNYNSLCLFEGYKGAIEELPDPEFKAEKPGEKAPDEAVFVGVLATGTFTEAASSVAIAKQDFAIRADAVHGSPVGIGEESSLATTKEETNKYGIHECGTVAAVRVKNEVAGFAISGVTSGACGAAAQLLLGEVAAKL